MLLLPASTFAQDSAPFASFVAASDPVLNDPHDLAFGPDGNLYIADKFANQVAIMYPDTLEVIGNIGDGALFGAHDVSFGGDGRLYVAATGLSAVVVYDLSGTAPVNVGTLGPFPQTEGVLTHSNGRIDVMAAGSGQLFAVDGDQVVAAASGMVGAHDVAEAPDGRPVVMFHGNPGSRLAWGAMSGSPFLPGLRIIAPDRPGYGRTQFKRNALIHWPQDVKDLLDHLQIEKAILFRNTKVSNF